MTRLLELGFLERFTDPRSGELRELREPDGEPTGRQLRALNRAGCLAAVEPGKATPLSKGACAWLLDRVGETDGAA